MLIYLIKGKKYLSRYKSGIRSNIKKNYNVIKQKYQRVLKALKKIQYQRYKVKFIMEIDVNVLVAQLN